MGRETTMHCQTAPATTRRRRMGLKRAFETIFPRFRRRRQHTGAGDGAVCGARARALSGRRLARLTASAAIALLAAACGQLPSSPPPTTRVALPDGFYRPSPAGAQKIPLNVVLMPSPHFAAESFTAVDPARVYHITIQPALTDAMRDMLAATFASARVAASPADVGAAQLVVHPAVNLGLNFSQNIFSENITASAAVYLVLADARTARQLTEFQRQASASALGRAPWDVGGFYTGFRAGGDNGALVQSLIASALAADLDRLADDLRQAGLSQRLARARQRPPLPPDLVIPKIPYVPNALEGVAGAQP
jgi:hypothetical protein